MLDRGFLPRSRMADKYADERTYAFARGKGCQLVVAISNEVDKLFLLPVIRKKGLLFLFPAPVEGRVPRVRPWDRVP